MEERKFYKLVEDMRKMQKEYFRFRSNRALVESKRLERAVDEEIERFNGIERELREPRLFE